MNCEMCDAQEEEYRLIYKDELVYAFVNLEPLHEFHVMALPIRHVKHIEELTKEESYALNQLIAKLRDAILKDHPSMTAWVNEGEDRSQQDHVHYHLIPFEKGKAIREMYSQTYHTSDRQQASKEKLEEIKNSFAKHIKPE